MSPRSFDENLALYAKLAIHGGVCLQPGQELILAADVQDKEFARLVVKEVYIAGAKNVFTMFGDEAMSLLRFEHGSDEAMEYAPEWLINGFVQAYSGNAARLAIFSSDPNLLKNVAPDRIAKYSKSQGLASRPLMEFISGFKINWSIVGAPSPAWAKVVFPNDAESLAMKKLWDAIFLTSRIFEADPLTTWTSHCDSLERRQTWLNKHDLVELHFKGPGTDLHVGLAENHQWKGGWGYAKNGVKCGPNVPTEEVFTMPHRANVNGVVSSTKPLSVRGQLLEGIVMEFKDGAAVKATSKTGEETLHKLLETDEGANRLGEVALVPASSKVSQAGILFYNTLYDENAACHIAMGKCYSENMAGYDALSDEIRTENGANDSLIHVDWMIGSREVDVDATAGDGTTIPLMRSGEWVEKV